LLGREPDLLVRLAQRGEFRAGIARFGSTAGEADLPRMRPQLDGALREKHRQPLRMGDYRDENGGRDDRGLLAPGIIVPIDRERRRTAALQPRSQTVRVEAQRAQGAPSLPL